MMRGHFRNELIDQFAYQLSVRAPEINLRRRADGEVRGERGSDRGPAGRTHQAHQVNRRLRVGGRADSGQQLDQLRTVLGIIDDQNQPIGLELLHLGAHCRLIVASKAYVPATLVSTYPAGELERKAALAAARSGRDDEQLIALRYRIDDLRPPQLIPDQGSTVTDQGTTGTVLQERLVVRLPAYQGSPRGWPFRQTCKAAS